MRNVLCLLYIVIFFYFLFFYLSDGNSYRSDMNYTSPHRDVQERLVLKGTKGRMTKSMTPFSLHCSFLFSSCPSFLKAPPTRGAHLSLTYFSCSFPLYIHFALMSFPPFLAYFGIVYVQTLDKRGHENETDGETKAGVGDRWRESEKMGGGVKNSRSCFLLQGPSYFILLYN